VSTDDKDNGSVETTELTESSGVEVTDGDDTVLDAPDDVETDVVTDEETAGDTAATAVPKAKRRSRFGKSRRLAYVVLPVLAVLLAAATGFLVWKDISASATEQARADSTQAAKDSTVRLLSYKPDTVEAELTSARDLLTGTFKDSYTQLTNDVVIPGAKEKAIAAVASVPAVASMEASTDHAVALVFVNQTVTVGDGAPTATASSVRVTLDKVDGRWLISQFDPV
jgi:Mce-associated membrane protein